MGLKNKYLFIFLLTNIIQISLFTQVFSATTSAGSQNSFILPQYSQLVSLDFKNADIRDVLKAFSRQIGANFIVSDAVKTDPITLFLDAVPVEDALKKILTANGLSYSYDNNDNILMIDNIKAEKNIITRVYPLKYATVASSKLQSTFGITAEEGGGNGSSSAGSNTVTTSVALVDILKTVLTASAKIAEDSRTNSLIISDEDTNFPLIERTLAKLDVPVAQILIEVQMIDVSKEVADEIGVKFGNTLYDFKGLGGRSFYFPLDQKNALSKGGTEVTYSQGAMGGNAFSAMLQFLKTSTDARNLARPRIWTMNNETAQIKITASEAIGVKVTAAATITQGSTVEPERVETGITLTVTPQLNLMTGDILLAVSPRVVVARLGGTYSGVTFKDTEIRSAKVKMRIHSGETVVLGGLLRSEKQKVQTKLPVLGDIPFLGRVFRHDTTTTKDRELLIFITPRVMDPGSDFVVDTVPADLGIRESSGVIRQSIIRSAMDSMSVQKK